MADLAEEARARPRQQSDWGGYTLAINANSDSELRHLFMAALDAGATLVAKLQEQDWGGTSGYIADPDGNRWELAAGGPDPSQ